ncbi:MAG: hypothetical protein LZF62_50136 [Nitrospira sp.]|nr:MAG: hypothetical protein LZF62_50136 [Nitrospira sp.]
MWRITRFRVGCVRFEWLRWASRGGKRQHLFNFAQSLLSIFRVAVVLRSEAQSSASDGAPGNHKLVVNESASLYVDMDDRNLMVTKGGSMKQVIWSAALLSMCVPSFVLAQAETPKIDQRQANQERRIDQGIASGQLNEREATRLNNQQEHINKMEDKAKSDGVVTKKERARLKHAQDRTSRHIARQKHDRQQR